MSNIPSRISTRRNPRQLFNPLLDPERFNRERLNRQTSRRNLEDLGDQSLLDIHHIFVESHIHQSQEMTEFFKPLDFLRYQVHPMTFQMMLSRSSLCSREIMPSLPSLTSESLKSTWSVIAMMLPITMTMSK